MERVIFLEILDRRGRVRDRVRLAQLPATVGRAYTNDVIVEDRFVSPVHCTIREGASGEIVVEDRESLNGLRAASSRHAVSSLVLSSGDRFRVGETVLRVVEASHPIAPAEPMPQDESGALHALRDRWVAGTAISAGLLVLTLDAYLASYYDVNWVNVVSPGVFGMGGLALWAGVWAFANRLLTHRFDFIRHLACACLATTAIVLGTSFAEYSEFLSSSEEIGKALLFLAQAVPTLALLFAHLAILSVSTRKWRRVWALGGTVLLLALTALFSYEGAEGAVSEVPVAIPIKAFGGNAIPATSTSEFLEKARWVRDRVDEKARETDP
jgi:pSer/pThr/pTyr-binding forkhead associated (FHA) protein